MLKRLKKKWGIESNRRLIIILIIFSISGSSTLLIRKPVFYWMGINNDTPLYIKIVLSLLIITPSYQVIVLIYAFLLGEFRFFWEFEKKIFGRLLRSGR